MNRDDYIKVLNNYLELPEDIPDNPSLLEDIRSRVLGKYKVKIERDDSYNLIGKAGKSKDGYNIELSSFIKDKYLNYFLIHEFGHILYGHLYIPDDDRLIINDKVKSLFLGKHYFKEELSDKDYLDITDLLISQTMEMEVNSKVYLPQEIEIVEDVLDKVIINQVVHDKAPLDILDYVYNWINTRGDKGHLSNIILPNRLGLKGGLTYKDYLRMILSDDVDNLMNYFRDLASLPNEKLISIKVIKQLLVSNF